MLANPVYVVDGARTPFLKSKNRPGPFAAADLATQAGRALLVRQKFDPTELDEVILGCAAPSVDEVNIGRVAALRMGCGQKVPGWTVMRNCASGMQSIDSGMSNILAGRSQLVLAGGVDALSRAPLLYGDKMVLWFSDMAAARTRGQKISLFGRLPVKAQDAATLAPGGGELEPLYDRNGNAYALDDGVRKDASIENLAKLRPFFDRKYGNVTPGNSSQITDGAAWLILASEEAVRRHDLKDGIAILRPALAGFGLANSDDLAFRHLDPPLC